MTTGHRLLRGEQPLRVRAAATAGTTGQGVLPDDDVVLFGDADNRFAAAVLWLLRLHGHQ